MGDFEKGAAFGAGVVIAASFALRAVEGEWPSGFALGAVALVTAGLVAWDLRAGRRRG